VCWRLRVACCRRRSDVKVGWHGWRCCRCCWLGAGRQGCARRRCRRIRRSGHSGRRTRRRRRGRRRRLRPGSAQNGASRRRGSGARANRSLEQQRVQPLHHSGALCVGLLRRSSPACFLASCMVACASEPGDISTALALFSLHMDVCGAQADSNAACCATAWQFALASAPGFLGQPPALLI
jgi:hypothetical protein